MWIISAWTIYLTILCGALVWTQSTSGWVLLGLAPVIWLDRHVFHQLPWSNRRSWLGPLILRVFAWIATAGLLYLLGTQLGWFLLGDREGNRATVTLPRALVGGLVVTMGLFLLELTLDGGVRLVERLRPRKAVKPMISIGSLAVIGCVGLLVFAIAPLNVFHPIAFVPVVHPGLHQPPLAYEEVKFRTSDGMDIGGWWVPADEARGTVVFCHGHGGNRQQGHGLLPHFHALGLNVLTFDFRGHGWSSPAPASFGLNEVRDFWAAEAFAAQRAPGKPVYAFGVSYGAAVTMQALPQAKHVRAAWVESGFSRLSDVAHNRFRNLPDGFRDPLIFTYSVLILLDCGFWPLNANPIDHAANCRVPVFFCHGSEDGLIPIAQGHALYERYAGPKQCYWVEGAHHGSVSTVGGEEYMRRLKEFFEERLRAAAE
ncbi:MAG: alpha/beta fold hydrolase [Planctomycetia bacterium]|nr:alpha/beta fold hydrolase [Planctomycetia bacterium]